MKTRILIGTLLATMLTIIFAPAIVLSPAEAGWHGTSDMFGTHWRSDNGARFSCRSDMFGTHCN